MIRGLTIRQRHATHLCAQSHLTLCDRMDCNLSGSSVHGIFQARRWEQVAISYLGDLPNPQTWERTHVSCIGRQILYHWTTWEALLIHALKLWPRCYKSIINRQCLWRTRCCSKCFPWFDSPNPYTRLEIYIIPLYRRKVRHRKLSNLPKVL